MHRLIFSFQSLQSGEECWLGRTVMSSGSAHMNHKISKPACTVNENNCRLMFYNKLKYHVQQHQLLLGANMFFFRARFHTITHIHTCITFLLPIQ